MRDAARKGNVHYTVHAREEMYHENISEGDVINCILTGEIVKRQWDIFRFENKYVIYGDSLKNDEIAVVAKLTYNNDVAVITVYTLTIQDYD
jgi:uncharacterized protein DUF4258